MELTKIAATIEDSLQTVADIIPGHIAGLAVLPDLITRLETAVAAIEHLVGTIDPALLHPTSTAAAAPVAHVTVPVTEPVAVPRPVVSELAAPLPEPAVAVQPASTPVQTAVTVTPTVTAAAGVPDELGRPVA